MISKQVWGVALLGLLLLGTGAGRKPGTTPTIPETPDRPGQSYSASEQVVPAVTAAPKQYQPSGLPMKPDRAAMEITAAQQAIKNLTADFSFKIIGAAQPEHDFTAQGKVWMASGRRYRVQYEQPERQLLVSDGTKRWFYLEKINQVQIQALPSESDPNDIFLKLGGGLPKLISQCRVKRLTAGAGKNGIRQYELIPRDGAGLGFTRVLLWLEGKYLLPRRVEIVAARHVQVEFRNVKINHNPETSSWFSFTPPAEAEVIEMFWPSK
ncbi:outer membrane lipoprotein carrier protein LolA [bacterium]|nr:outer membrane lipoprotein carrier protein LolA [bacterium]